MVIKTHNSAIIEFFIHITDQTSNGIILETDDGKKRILSPSHYPLDHLTVPLCPDSKYTILYKGLILCLCYTYEPETIIQTGVTFLEAASPKNALHHETVHLTPPKNWMNDPNGLCWYQGFYHMFYQFHPYAPVPGCMYWGHAVSQDLLHWRHLPVVFEPQEEIMNHPELRGGAWSGSALALPDYVMFFFTRHIGPNSDRTVKNEYQVTATSRDMVNFSEETTIISEIPSEGISSDMRDPKIFYYDQTWYLILGSAYNKNPAVLLYVSKDLFHWKYRGILYQEESDDTIAFECPDFFEINGKFVLIVSKLNHTDKMGRKNTIHYYIGDFHGQYFQPEIQGILDFGGNLYAVQSFSHLNRRIAFGWISDFYQEHRAEQNQVYGSMSLPRELQLNHGRLFFSPAREVYSMLGNTLYSGFTESVQIPLPVSYYVKLEFAIPADFSIHLNHRTDGGTFDLFSKNGIIEFSTKGTASGSVRFCTPAVRCLQLELFIDHRTCEVFINGGEWSGTKTFYGDGSCRQFIFSSRASVSTKPHLTIRALTLS